ncbi:hypothetical protein MKX03_033033 [Papaver bracteatum]|nr:hypothetical protein MKX03_033033 [Papaver bracteatum]
MSKSISVLGFAAILFALTSFCALSVEGFVLGDIFVNKKYVSVQNDIDPNILLVLHCRSSEDDLGEHTLNYKQSFKWSFKVNWKQTTTFSCDSSWYESASGKMYHLQQFNAYKAKRDWRHHCEDLCYWSIRQDGGYYGGEKFEGYYPFEKMFSY